MSEHITAMYKSLGRNTDSAYYRDLVALLESRLERVKDEMVDTGSVDEYRRLQGRAQELREFLGHLKRKPAVKQRTGAYGV